MERRGVFLFCPAQRNLRQHIPNHLPRQVGEAVVAALEGVGELKVVDAEEMEEGGVKIIDVD